MQPIKKTDRQIIFDDRDRCGVDMEILGKRGSDSLVLLILLIYFFFYFLVFDLIFCIYLIYDVASVYK